MDEKTIQALLIGLCTQTDAVYIASTADGRIIYASDTFNALVGFAAAGQAVDEVISSHPQLRELFAFQRDEMTYEWEYYDTVHKRMYALRQYVQNGYAAVGATNITDVLELNCSITDYLKLMNSLSNMQAELIACQDRTIEILMKALIHQFSAQAVYVSYRSRQSRLMLWSLAENELEVHCNEIDRLPDAVRCIAPKTIRAADITYEFRVVSPEPPEAWDANHAIVMNLAGIYLESATLREQIKWDNGHDRFTGLLNRAYYIIATSERYTKLTSVGVVFVDIDNLKKTNDEKGHHAGDLLIKKAAAALLSFSSDTVDAYRMGGDEFMLVLCDCKRQDAEQIVSKLHAAVEAQNEVIPFPELQLSVGFSYSEHPRDMEAVIRAADQQMYQEKVRHKAVRK